MKRKVKKMNEKFFNKNKSKVALIVYVNNLGDDIIPYLEDLKKQTLDDLEIIIWNDYSTDTVPVQVIEYIQDSSQIRLIHTSSIDRFILNELTSQFFICINYDQHIKENLLDFFYDKATFLNLDLIALMPKDPREYIDVSIKKECYRLFEDESFFSFKDCPDFIFNFFPMNLFNKFFKLSFLKKEAKRYKTDHVNRLIPFSVIDAKMSFFLSNLKNNFFMDQTPNYEFVVANLLKLENVLKKRKIYYLVKKSFENFVLQSFYSLRKLSEPSLNSFYCYMISEGIEYFNLRNPKDDYFYDKSLVQWLNSLDDVNISVDLENFLMFDKDKIVPIIMTASSESEGLSTLVTIQSIVEHASPDYFYDIYILHRAIPVEIIQKMGQLNSKNIRISCLITDSFVSEGIYRKFQCESYIYMTLAPQLISFYKKILYISSKVLVLSNLIDIFQKDIGKFILAGFIKNKNRMYVEECLGCLKESFISPDILLINLEKYGEGLVTQFAQYDTSSYEKPFEDTLNVFFKNKIIPFLPEDIGVVLCAEDLKRPDNIYSKNETLNFLIYNSIPLTSLSCQPLWWSYARKSNCYEDILFYYLNRKQCLKTTKISSSKEELSQQKNQSTINKTKSDISENVDRIGLSNDEMMQLKTDFVKECFLAFFTFGQAKKQHKENIRKLAQYITEQQNMRKSN